MKRRNVEDMVNELDLGEQNGIHEQIICKECMAEVKAGHPELSPEEYARVEVGFSYGGKIRVYCRRHKRVVVDLQLAAGEQGGPIPI